MEFLCTSAESRALDRFAGEKLKIPADVLMENAARGIVDAIERRRGPVAGKSYTIVCGKGNNGGDGLAAARHLALRGAGKILVLTTGSPASFSPLARMQFEILKRMSSAGTGTPIILRPVRGRGDLRSIPASDVLIDALIGTGCHDDVSGVAKLAVDWMNSRSEFTVSADVPSGLDADNGFPCGTAVHADLTVTMAAVKIGLVTGKGPAYAGEITLTDIGCPPAIPGSAPTVMRVVQDDIAPMLPRRAFDSHKYSVGRIFVLAGSRGFTGAAAMTVTAVLRSGAGAVVLGTPESVYPILAKKLTEVMVTPLWETAGGTVGGVAYDQLKTHIDWADVLLLGPGIGRHDETTELIFTILRKIDKPVLLDADALNAVSSDPSILKKTRGDTILTPHAGEFSRLTGVANTELEKIRLSAGRDFAKRFSLTLVLKGAPSLVATEEGQVYINSTGNPGMATAGSGDVLAGLICGLRAQGMSSRNAAIAGVFIHGSAGDLAKQELGERSLLADDISRHLPAALRRATASASS